MIFLLAASTKRYQRYHPTTNLRRFQWEKIPDIKVQNTIWKNMTATPLADSKTLEVIVHELGVFSEIESIFSISKPKSKSLNSLTENPKPIIEQEVKLIDNGRAQNVMIMLGRLKQYTFEELQKAVLKIDEGVLSENVVRQFMVYAPTLEEVKFNT